MVRDPQSVARPDAAGGWAQITLDSPHPTPEHGPQPVRTSNSGAVVSEGAHGVGNRARNHSSPKSFRTPECGFELHLACGGQNVERLRAHANEPQGEPRTIQIETHMMVFERLVDVKAASTSL
jgi:hypothetical protein